MALRTLGTTLTTSLNCLSSWATSLSAADVAAIASTITDDARIASILSGYGAGVTAVLATGTTHTNTTLDTLVAVSGAALSQIQVGDLVLKADVPPGTFVARLISATSVQLSQAASGGNNQRTIFVRPEPPFLSFADQRLVVPNRGVLNVLPGDIVATDNCGGVILVTGASIGYAGSQWVLT